MPGAQILKIQNFPQTQKTEILFVEKLTCFGFNPFGVDNSKLEARILTIVPKKKIQAFEGISEVISGSEIHHTIQENDHNIEQTA